MALASETTARRRVAIPDLPLAVWIVLATLALLLAAGDTAEDVVAAFTTGFASSLGEFALLLLPSFILAGALSHMAFAGAPAMAVGVGPFAGAGMVCPDTAYAALSPIAGPRKLELAFSAYAGFKLLYPAGPLLVATGLGVEDATLLAGAALLFIPIWGVGVIWAARFSKGDLRRDFGARAFAQIDLRILTPILILAALLIAGMLIDAGDFVIVGFFLKPSGALAIAAIVSLIMIDRQSRRPCVDRALARTSALLMLIGVASAFGLALTQVVPVASLASGLTGSAGLIGLFALAAAFKLMQGSSMATFAAVAPVAAPIVADAGLSATPAVLAICLGSFVAVLPNDSYYWLVRRDALPDETDRTALVILGVGAVLQALVGLSILITVTRLGVM